MVTTEAVLPHSRKPLQKTDCLVHQFLDSQRRARHDREDNLNPHPHPHGNSHHVERTDTSYMSGMDRMVEPKGGSENGQKTRCEVLEPPSSEASDIGQVDEKEWQSGIVKTTSEVDMVHAGEALHSRLLTKKQLSEMAWGVRELSRRLGSMRLKFRVKNVFLLTKIYDQDLIPKTRALTKWLLDKDRDVRYTVYIERNLKENKKFDAAGLIEEVRKDYVESGEMTEEASKEVYRRLRYWDESICRTRPHTFDFVITLGGDGTVLYASWLFQRIVPPVLSFALGSLGFLTKFDFDDYQKILTGAFNEGVTVSLRLRFEGTVMRSQKKRQNLLTNGTIDGTTSGEEDEEELHRRRDLVEELIGEEKDDAHTHRPDGTYEILNEIVIDRGPNPSKTIPVPKSHSISR